MTAKQKAYRRGLLRSIHTTLRYRQTFAQDRDLWETFLQEHYRVRSSADLSIEDLISLLGYLRGECDAPQAARVSEAQLGFIWHQWQERSTYKDSFALLRFAKRILRREIDDLDTLTRTEASKLIGAIKGLQPKAAANDTRWEP